MVAQFAAEHAGRAPAVLDAAAKRRAARIAVAEVQQHHAVWSMAQLRFEVHRALPVLKPSTDAEALVTEVAKLAVCGRAGTEVVQLLAWTQMLALAGNARRWEPKRLRLRPAQNWPWAADITAAIARLQAISSG